MLGKGVSGPPVPHTNVGGGSCGGGDKGGSCVGVEGRIKGGGGEGGEGGAGGGGLGNISGGSPGGWTG